jgi:DNA-binding IclR family transcriptional regulator
MTQASSAARPVPRSVTARALAVLDAFDGGHPRLSLSEIARRAGLPVPTAYRLVRELEAWRALHRDRDGRYEIGPRLWQLGLLSGVHSRLRALATPVMHQLYAACGEVVGLAVRDGDTALLVDRLAGHDVPPWLAPAGSHLPLHATGVGKVLLAHAPGEVVRQAVGQARRLTAFTVVEPGRLLRELDVVRATGVATTAEERALGACSIAVPVGRDGQVVAALALVAGPRRDLRTLLPPLRRAAETITARLAAVEPGRVAG